jgi:hypothetical protein
MSRRLDDRIKNLASRVVQSNDEDVRGQIAELKFALCEHATRLRKLAATKLAGAKETVPERRSHKDRRSNPSFKD